MNDQFSSDPNVVWNLAKAREILMLEAEKLMPIGAASQRECVLQTIENLIRNALAELGNWVPGLPSAGDVLCNRARDYLLAVQKDPAHAPDISTPYELLCGIFEQVSQLELAAQIIEWIQSSHNLAEIMPEVMEDANAAIRIFSQRLLLQPAAREAVETLRSQPAGLAEDAKRNASLMVNHWIQRAGLSEAFVDELSRTNAASFRVWEKAKPSGDFAVWLPHFSDVVKCARRKAAILGEALHVSPYQAMLEQFNPGLRNETVNTIFAALYAKLPPLLKRISEKQAAEAKPVPLPGVPPKIQRRVIKRIIDALGFDPAFSRIDESMHPFSTGEWDDVRVTTHYHEDNLLSGVMSVVHEMGHLFYSRNLPEKWKYQPIGMAQSMWIHESQSLFWEKQIGCSREFMEFLSAILREELDSDAPVWGAANLHTLVTRIRPGLIRIEADEVTYPAHIILRHRIEQDIITGVLAPEGLPSVWAEQMRRLLGVDVPDHAHGCMQDVHWTDGSFGYFPAYSFGALAAAQFMETAVKAMPDLARWVRTGTFLPIRQWLKEHIHQAGSHLDGEALLSRVTGKDLSVEPWLAHIERRYLGAH